MGQADRNSNWMGRVRVLLAEGFGVEDIALKTNSPVECVRNEVAILRESNELGMLYQGARWAWRRAAS